MEAPGLVATFFVIFVLIQKDVLTEELNPECKNITKDDTAFFRCCKLPAIVMAEDRKGMAEACHKTVFGNRSEPLSEKEEEEMFECFEECYFKSNNLLTADMKLNETSIIAEYEAEMKNFPVWKDLMTKTVKVCLANNDISNPKAKCNSGAYQFSNCLQKSIFLHCPEDSWLGTDEKCVSTKKDLEKCIASMNKS